MGGGGGKHWKLFLATTSKTREKLDFKEISSSFAVIHVRVDIKI